MSWIRATKTTDTANAATYTVNLPEHQSGDLLLVWLTQDVGGKVSGAGTGTETFRNPADTKDRLVVTVDSSGNRTAITLDLD